MEYLNTQEFAREQDQKDELASFRNRFFIPQRDGKDVIYFTGNSLGLQPKTVQNYIQQELNDWATHGVEGHFLAKAPWFTYHHFLTSSIAKIVGAKEIEVCAMNTLSVNLNLLMVSFYRPTVKKFKILIEQNAFPSDNYAVEQQIKFHGYDPKEGMIIVPVEEGKPASQSILESIEKHKDELALVMIGGVNYYTGQVFDLKSIAAACQKHDIVVGYDLAHAAGNIELKLNEWGVDFATWCSYKYLNSGPGGVSGIFVHERHSKNSDLPRFAGWWGNDEKTRFTMPHNFIPQEGAAGWQMSNAQILPMASHRASLEIFDEAGMPRLRAKSIQLTGYLSYLLEGIKGITILTPQRTEERGCQISMLVTASFGRDLFNYLTENGVVADWREPNVIRVAPAPLYNTFDDVYTFVKILRAYPQLASLQN